MVNGVSQVTVQGAEKYAVRIQVDPDKLEAEKIGINEVDQALQNWNVNLPTGQLFGTEATYNIVTEGSSTTPPRSDPSSLPTATARRCTSTRSRTSWIASKS